MIQQKNRTAMRALCLLALMLCASLAFAAQVAGTVVRLSGPLLAKKGDGTVKVLAIKSEVEQGDTLVSEKNTYAMIKFIDNSEMVLKPATVFKIESFSFNEGKPEDDSATFSLVKGGLRAVTGALGKRSKEKFALKAPTATIGIRGTTFLVDYIEPSEEAVAALQAFLMASVASNDAMAGAEPLPIRLAAVPPAPVGGGLAPGLYVHVIDGIIHLTNQGGAQTFTAGQFGYTGSSLKPPVIVPNNPGLQFSPPPSFSQIQGSNSGPSGSQKGSAVDCVVR